MSDFFSEPPEDVLARLRAEVDQTIKSTAEMAKLARGLFDTYSAQDFTEAQAMRLTIWHLDKLMGGDEDDA